MSSPAPQSYENHGRIVPLYHVVTFGLLLVNFAMAGKNLFGGVNAERLAAFGLAIALILLFFFARLFALAVQDRVIRLEMRLRLQGLAPGIAARFHEFTPGQLVALRFAGDAELPGLAQQILDGRLVKPVDIKKSIRDWQADTLRV